MVEPISASASILGEGAFKIIDRLIAEVAQYFRDQKNQERAAQASQAQLQFMAPFWAEGLRIERTRNVIELVATARGMMALGTKLYDLAVSAGRAKAALEREVWLENSGRRTTADCCGSRTTLSVRPRPGARRWTATLSGAVRASCGASSSCREGSALRSCFFPHCERMCRRIPGLACPR